MILSLSVKSPVSVTVLSRMDSGVIPGDSQTLRKKSSFSYSLVTDGLRVIPGDSKSP